MPNWQVGGCPDPKPKLGTFPIPPYSAHQSFRLTHSAQFNLSSSILITPDGRLLQHQPGRLIPSLKIYPAQAGPQCKRTRPRRQKNDRELCSCKRCPRSTLASLACPPMERRAETIWNLLQVNTFPHLFLKFFLTSSQHTQYQGMTKWKNID